MLYLLYIQFVKILKIFEKPKPLLNIIRTHTVYCTKWFNFLLIFSLL